MKADTAISGIGAVLCFFALAGNAGAIGFVQVKGATPQSPQSSATVTYAAAQRVGDTNVVAVGWNDAVALVTSVTDSNGNPYRLAVGPTVYAKVGSQSIYYASSIAGAAANGNAVTVTFNVPAQFPDVRILEYSGLAPTNPVDVTVAATGSGSTSNSGSVTTSNANDLIFGANLVSTSTRGAGTGFTSRIITSPDGDIAEDRTVTAVGNYSAGSPLTASGPWVMQLVAFKAQATGLTDLAIAKTHTGNFAQGQSGASYTLTVSNIGAAATGGTVNVTDTLPAGLTATALNGTGWACTLASLTCTRGDALAAGASYPAIVLTVNVANNAPASLTNTATVSGGGDANAGNNIAYDLTTIAPSVSGLVAAYSFSEGSGTTVADGSGNGNTGMISNATWTSAGKYGNALVFNGNNAFVTIQDAASLHLTTAMTLEAWVNPATINAAWRDVIYKGNDNYYLEATSASAGVPAGGGAFAAKEVFATTTLAANTWAHLALTYDGATLRLYLNGTQVSSLAQTGTIPTSTNPLQIGGDSLFGQYFNGIIDEVRVYNVALTAAQVQADMNSQVGTVPSAPGNLAVIPVGTGQVDLSWTASTGSLAVTGYLLERCQGVGCVNFAQVAAPAGTTYNDSTVAANTNYSYRVRAKDTAGNLSAYSNVASTYTGLSITPGNVSLSFGEAQQFTTSGPGSGAVVWSVDGVAGGSTSSGTITTTGLYLAPGSIGTHTVGATTLDQTQSASAAVTVVAYQGTLTYHNDNVRSGQNLSETTLTPTNVNPATFGKLFSYQLDGNTFASPLYLPNLSIPGNGTHDVVFVATEHDSVYAYDANGLSSIPLWQVSFINPGGGVTTVPAADTGETVDIPGEIGITGTPVIDPASKTLYVVAATKEVHSGTTSYVQRLHALDVGTGAEKFGGPAVIQASAPSVGGPVPFDPLRENQRAALLLANGVVYLGFSSHGDVEPYYGWVLGYDAATLKQVMVVNTAPNAQKAGVWMDGDGPANDATGNIFFLTGDGIFDIDSGGIDYGDCFLKVNTAGTVLDYFSPSVQTSLDAGNLDLGSGGILLLPDQGGAHPHEMVSAGKNGTIYLVDRDNLGHYNQSSDQIVQTVVNIFSKTTGIEGGNFSSPVYFDGNIYFSPVSDNIQSFGLSSGLLQSTPSSRTSKAFGFRGGTMAISANGAANGILWALESNGTTVPGVLHAYDAVNLATELYNSDQAGSRDTLPAWSKFSLPLIAKGKVYAVGVSELTVYGLLP